MGSKEGRSGGMVGEELLRMNCVPKHSQDHAFFQNICHMWGGVYDKGAEFICNKQINPQTNKYTNFQLYTLVQTGLNHYLLLGTICQLLCIRSRWLVGYVYQL